MQQTNHIQVPDWARVQNPAPFTYADAPRQYRFDGDRGGFYLGEIGQGKLLSAQIFDQRWVYEERWGRPQQSWLDIAFIDQDNVVSILAMKKESAINLHEFFVRLDQLHIFSPLAVEVVLETEERNSDDGDYYVVRAGDFEFVTPERCEALAQFVATIPFAWVFTGECG